MRSSIFFVFLVFGFCFPPSALAKEWDPRLERSMELSFAGTPEQAEPLLRSYRQSRPGDPTGIIFWTLVQEWKAGMGPGNHEEVHPENQILLQEALTLAENNLANNLEGVDEWIDLGNAYFFLARNLAEQDSFIKSGMTGKKLEEPMRKALQKDPERKEAYLALGAYHYFAGNTPKFWVPLKKLFGIHGDKVGGLRELNQALAGNHPFRWQARYALLEIYLYHEKNPELALKELKHFEESFPENPLVPMKKAQIYEKDNPQLSIQLFSELGEECGKKFKPCPKKFPFYAYSQAGLIYLKQKDFAMALDFFEKARQVDPGNYPKRSAQIKKWRKQSLKEIARGQSQELN